MKKKTIILGAGLAGLSIAREILKRRDFEADIEIIEREPYVGGLSASFVSEGIMFDFGSHRLHPSAPKDILDDISALLGKDLIRRPRNGRIFLDGRFISFPVRLIDAALHLPLKFLAGTLKDSIFAMLKRRKNDAVSYEEEVVRRFGKTFCESFYFPYARKLWGIEPNEISTEQASRRVSAGNPFYIIFKAVSLALRRQSDNSGSFYYPRKGFGQIADKFAHDVIATGGKLRLSTAVCEIHLHGIGASGFSINIWQNNAEQKTEKNDSISADFIFSTIPVESLIQMIRPQAPDAVIKASENLKYRAMLFVYLILKGKQFSQYDAHYFPNPDVIFSRVSEPKNYSGTAEPDNATGLCAEIPCNSGDDIWNTQDNEIIKKVVDDLEHIGFSIKPRLKTAFIRRITNVYPVYDLNFRKNLNVLNNYLDGLPNIISSGRQGLFLHNNIHNSIEAGRRACECLKPDLELDVAKWKSYRKKAENDVVLD